MSPFQKLKYFLADDGEVGGVGGAVVLKQDDAGQHHVDEHQSAAAESWSCVLALEYMEIENRKTTKYFNQRDRER